MANQAAAAAANSASAKSPAKAAKPKRQPRTARRGATDRPAQAPKAPMAPADPSYRTRQPASVTPTVTRPPAVRQMQHGLHQDPLAPSTVSAMPSMEAAATHAVAAPGDAWPELSTRKALQTEHDIRRQNQWSQPANFALESKRPAAPRITAEKRYWEPFFISPLDVHFAHDTIKDAFRPPYPSILETLRKLATGSLQTQEVECIRVVWSEELEWRKGKGDNRWYVAGTFNRRLCMYRLLCIFFPERWRRIQVQRVPNDSVHWTLQSGRHKYSTECQGDAVEIRPGKFVGKTEDSVKWPEASDLLRSLRSFVRA